MVLDRKARIRIEATRSNTAPDGCAPAAPDSEPPPPATGCGTRALRASGFLAIDRGPRGSSVLRVDTGLLTRGSGEGLGSFSDPFLRTPASLYPRCLMPNGQQWVTGRARCGGGAAKP